MVDISGDKMLREQREDQPWEEPMAPPHKDLRLAYACHRPYTQVRGSLCAHHFGGYWKKEVRPMKKVGQLDWLAGCRRVSPTNEREKSLSVQCGQSHDERLCNSPGQVPNSGSWFGAGYQTSWGRLACRGWLGKGLPARVRDKVRYDFARALAA